MKRQPVTNEQAEPARTPARSQRLVEAGIAAARAARVVREHGPAPLEHHAAGLQKAIIECARGSSEAARWLSDNYRLIRSSLKDTMRLERMLREHPVVAGPSREVPRVYAIAQAYLTAVGEKFSEDDLVLFLQGCQRVVDFNIGEVWSLRPALQFIILDRLGTAEAQAWPLLVTSLRHIADCTWKDIFEAVSRVDSVLADDPSRAYTAMDYESREIYRRAIIELARRSACSEAEVAETALSLAMRAAEGEYEGRGTERRAHVGFYLIDEGVSQLRAAIHYHPRPIDRLRDAVLTSPTAFYLISIEVVTFLTVVALLSGLSVFTPILAGILLLLLPATQAAVDFINNAVSTLLEPRALPKLDFSRGIPGDCATMVAVPTLLLNEPQVRDLVLDLEIRFLANRDPNLYFALLTDSPDSEQPVDELDLLVTLCRELIDGLNRRYSSSGHSPFYLFHRHRAYNPSEGRWMGWERKRGKLLDLNRLLRGGFDSFPVKTGDLSVLPHIRYIITVDSDTQLPRESAARLVGTIAHPLNRAVVDPVAHMVVEGYGILQPRIGISIQSASRSRLASIYSGQTGFDIYTRAVSDVYQDLFGEGIFTGKGIYEVDALREVLEERFPENALLSHDLIEGAYARAGLVSDIELIDDYPSHFSAYSRRKHRWVRGDWQIMRWLLARVPDYSGRLIRNPISLISRWKILDNLRRSVLEPSILVLLVAGWLYLPGRAWYWTLATLAVLFLPVYTNLLFSLARAPRDLETVGVWARETASAFVQGNVRSALSLVFLLHQTLLSIDAIVRSTARVLVTGRKLLEWETAAEAEAAVRPKSTVDVYLEWTPWISAALAGLVWLFRPRALPEALPVLALWFASRGISAWLNRPPRTSNRELTEEDTALLRDWGERMARFFREWSGESTNWLIPDHVREDGEPALKLSPTNLGMLLNARIASVHLGVMPLAQFVFETQATLDRMGKLPKHRGHFLNWCDIRSFAPIEPRFVSTVDSGNLAACLWTLKQAALAFAAEPKAKRGLTAGLSAALDGIAESCDRMVREMDFRFLYQPRKRVLSIGYDVGMGKLEDASYDLLASEARIASFIAVAKGDIPQEAWFRLGRAHVVSRGERALLSWTGTMFEYLMPALWMRHHPGTIAAETMRAVVRIQREYARRKGVPWGISESAYCGESGDDYGYQAFGVPDLAVRRTERECLVIAPYATFLALPIEPAAALKNLRAMAEFGWTGRYGFYEAIDYHRAGGEVIRSWMAHHQGMSLLAVCNMLCNDPMQRYFHAEPQVMATELLLHERAPTVAAEQAGLEAEAMLGTA